jgi:hypothetical protein
MLDHHEHKQMLHHDTLSHIAPGNYGKAHISFKSLCFRKMIKLLHIEDPLQGILSARVSVNHSTKVLQYLKTFFICVRRCIQILIFLNFIKRWTMQCMTLYCPLPLT